MRKGSYFFVIDAFVAAIIITGTILVVFGSYTDSTSSRESFYASEDLLVLLESTEVRDFEADIVRDWIADGTINDSSRALLTQIGYFNVTGRNLQASQLADVALTDVPDHVSVRMRIDEVTLAENQVVPDYEADVFFTSKRILLLRKETTDLFPPVIIEVQTWQ